MATKSVTFPSTDGLSLEGRLALPEVAAGGVAVLCHPYPPAGGSMSNAMLPYLQRTLEARGWSSIRFNFRGVGRSEGSFDHGRGEARDVGAALRFAREQVPGVPAAVIGWSFGALVGLTAAAADGAEAYVGIAPPLSVAPELDLPALPGPRDLGAWTRRSLIVCGSMDAFCSPDDAGRLASDLGAGLSVVEGADHFFGGRLAELGDVVGEFLAGASG
jgi:hypothetical protein